VVVGLKGQGEEREGENKGDNLFHAYSPSIIELVPSSDT
jgi:hypothetical protein